MGMCSEGGGTVNVEEEGMEGENGRAVVYIYIYIYTADKYVASVLAEKEMRIIAGCVRVEENKTNE